MQISMILAILEKILMYGPRAVIVIAEAFNKDTNPTVAEIKALVIVKDPEEYFE